MRLAFYATLAAVVIVLAWDDLGRPRGLAPATLNSEVAVVTKPEQAFVPPPKWWIESRIGKQGRVQVAMPGRSEQFLDSKRFNLTLRQPHQPVFVNQRIGNALYDSIIAGCGAEGLDRERCISETGYADIVHGVAHRIDAVARCQANAGNRSLQFCVSVALGQ